MHKRDFEILNGFTILYIEDEMALRKHTSAILEDFVKHIFAVEGCEEAIEILQREHIDVIIADILLENESGIECLRHIKEKMGLKIPAILTTAHTDTELLLEAIKLKVENYLVKPINIKELLSALHDIFKPMIQQKEIDRTQNIIKTIAAVIDGKQVELVRFVIRNLDNDNILNYSYSEIMDQTGISKPTIIKLFKQLMQKGILTKVQNGKYRFDARRLEIRP